VRITGTQPSASDDRKRSSPPPRLHLAIATPAGRASVSGVGPRAESTSLPTRRLWRRDELNVLPSGREPQIPPSLSRLRGVTATAAPSGPGQREQYPNEPAGQRSLSLASRSPVGAHVVGFLKPLPWSNASSRPSQSLAGDQARGPPPVGAPKIDRLSAGGMTAVTRAYLRACIVRVNLCPSPIEVDDTRPTFPSSAVRGLSSTAWPAA